MYRNFKGLKMERKSRQVEQFFLDKINSGVLVEKKGLVFNEITKNTYEKPCGNSRPHTISLYNKDFKNKVATLASNRVLWMIRNKKLIPENTKVMNDNGTLKTYTIDTSKNDYSKVGAKRKTSEKDSAKAMKRFINEIPHLKSIKQFCEKENLNYGTFYRDLRLENNLSSVSEDTLQVVEGVMKFYTKVKSSRNGVTFKTAHDVRFEYARKPMRIAHFAKYKGMSDKEIRNILENKTKFIDGYIHDDDVINAKDNYYEKMKLDRINMAEDIRKAYIENPRNLVNFTTDMKEKYGLCRDYIGKILNNERYKDGNLAKRCLKVKKNYYSKPRKYESRN